MFHAFAKQLIKNPDYDGFRDFLQALQQEMRSRKRTYNHEQFARDLGISSGSVLNQILNGHRQLSEKQLSEMLKCLKFTGTAAKYFTALVRAEQIGTANSEQKGRVFDALVEAKAAIDPEGVPLAQYAYAREWYHPVVRELACDPELRGDPILIAESCRPKITPHQARLSLELLEREGFIRRNPDALHFDFGNTSTNSSPQIHWLIAERYHQTSLDLAKVAIVELNESKRSVTASTLKLTRQGFAELSAKVMELHAKAHALEAHGAEYDSVFQFTVQLFPVTRGKAK